MKWSLHKKFSVISFLIIFTLGLLLAYGLSNYINNHFLQLNALNTIRFSQKNILNVLTAKDFKQPLSIRTAAKIKKHLSNSVPEEVKRVKIWNTEGVIIYSENYKLIGKKYPIEDELAEALRDKVGSDLTDLSKSENLDDLDLHGELIEIYVPVKKNSKIVGAFEIYMDSNLLQEGIKEAQYRVWLSVTVGLLILYITLYQVVKQGSDTIEAQKRAMIELNSRIDLVEDFQSQTYSGSIKALLAALEARDNYTAGHAIRVTEYSMRLGEGLGFSQEELKRLEEAALLHDIGKIGVPEYILNKEAKLTNEEFDLMKKHSEIGADILRAMSCANDRAEIIRYHHERFDGNGYPAGLKGREIPMEARILSVADTYDTLTSNRPYRKKLSHCKAVTILRDCKGQQLDADLVELFIEVIERGMKQQTIG
jgi:putative nucleotidyltransferase with HDIG domain